MTMTKEQYIALRKSGKKRNEITKEYFGGDTTTFKIFLEKVGLLVLFDELTVIRDFDKPKELPFEPTKQEIEKVEYPPLTKELVESELAKGKSVARIERENGMKLNTLTWKMKGWGIVNPNPRKKADVQESAVIETKQSEVMHESPEMKREPAESVQEAEDTVIEQEVTYIPDCKVSWRAFDVPKKDLVNHPEHYTAGGIETIDIIQAKLSPEEYAGFLKGNIIKYITREKHKGGIESLRKAKWYRVSPISSRSGIF